MVSLFHHHRTFCCSLLPPPVVGPVSWLLKTPVKFQPQESWSRVAQCYLCCCCVGKRGTWVNSVKYCCLLMTESLVGWSSWSCVFIVVMLRQPCHSVGLWATFCAVAVFFSPSLIVAHLKLAVSFVTQLSWRARYRRYWVFNEILNI